MRAEDFSPAQRPHFVRTIRSYAAFIPPPLPPAFDVEGELARALSEADRAIGEFAGLVRSLPRAVLVAQSFRRREAVLSSRIEGTRSSLSDLVLFEIDDPSPPASDDLREVFNYVRAIEHLFAPDRELPLSLPLLLQAHALLMDGVRGAHVTPGEFRRTQNWIGIPGAVIDNATFVPPPPERLWECLDALEKYLHAPRSAPSLLDIAAIHYQFEAIHPFLDGNGRIGRLLVSLLLVEWGLLPGPILDLSAYIEPRREEYYSALLAVSTHGDWARWYAFMIEGFVVQSRDAVRRAQRLSALHHDFVVRVAGTRMSRRLLVLVDGLFRVPALTIRRAQDLLGVTHRAATQNVERLVALDILRELDSPQRRRLFVCDEVIAATEGR